MTAFAGRLDLVFGYFFFFLYKIELGIIPELVNALEELDWNLPTDVQAESIPSILGGRDVIAVMKRCSKIGCRNRNRENCRKLGPLFNLRHLLFLLCKSFMRSSLKLGSEVQQ